MGWRREDGGRRNEEGGLRRRDDESGKTKGGGHHAMNDKTDMRGERGSMTEYLLKTASITD